MSLTTKKISLDFYNHNITSIYAKQLDTESRIINVTCTDHGKKVSLDSSKMSVFVRYKKSDENIGFYDGQILDDGTIDIKLTQQMLAVTGKQVADVIIATATGIKAESLADISNLYDLGVTIISVMPFNIITIGTAVENYRIASESEFDALNAGITRLVATEKHLKEVEDILNTNEEIRKTNEENRIEAETQRELRVSELISDSNDKINEAIDKCEVATNDANDAKSNCETATTNANNATSNSKIATANADKATTEANNAATSATNAANAANAIVEECQAIIDEIEAEGAVLNSQVGVANGIASLDGNGKVPNSQMPFSVINNLTTTTTGNALDASRGKALNDSIGVLNNLIEQLQNKVNSLPVHRYGTSEPNNSVGNNNDIYFMIIEE